MDRFHRHDGWNRSFYFLGRLLFLGQLLLWKKELSDNCGTDPRGTLSGEGTASGEVRALYHIRFPSVPLRPFVECYWFLHGTSRPPQRLEELIFSDARADIVFIFDSPYVRIRADAPAKAELIRASNVDAQRRYPVRIQQHGHHHLVGVRFRPGGLAAFVRVPVYELSGHTVGLADVFGRQGAELEEKLFDEAGRPQVQAQLLDQFFLSRVAVLPEYWRVMGWMGLIEDRVGLMTVADLSQRAGLSVRSVDRLFQRLIGLPPAGRAAVCRRDCRVSCDLRSAAYQNFWDREGVHGVCTSGSRRCP